MNNMRFLERDEVMAMDKDVISLITDYYYGGEKTIEEVADNFLILPIGKNGSHFYIIHSYDIKELYHGNAEMEVSHLVVYLMGSMNGRPNYSCDAKWQEICSAKMQYPVNWNLRTLFEDGSVIKFYRALSIRSQ